MVTLYLGGCRRENVQLTDMLIRRFRTLQTVRRLNEQERWTAFALVNHRTKGASLSESPVPELKKHTAVPQNAVDDFTDYFVGNLVSPNIPWMGMMYVSSDMTSQDDMAGANDYMGSLKNSVMSEMAESNFYPQNNLSTKDEFCGACSAILIGNDDNRNVTTYTTLTPWNFWTDTDQYGEYDTLFYKKRMNVVQAYEKFGYKLPDWMQKIYFDANADPYEMWYDFLLCIYPRFKIKRKRRSKFAKQREFSVVWMYLADGSTTNSMGTSGKSQIIEESGSDWFPAVVSAWAYDGDNPYGTCPVMRNATEIRRADMLAYETALSIQKMNHNAYVGVASSLENFSDDPGARNIVQAMDLAPQPLPLTQTVEGAMSLQEKQESAIQKMFKNDIFSFLSRNDNAKVYTATQINTSKSEQLSLMAPMFGNYQRRIEKLVKLTVLNMAEHGRLPEGAKDILKGDGKVRVTIESTLAQELRAYTNRDANIALLEQCAPLMQIAPESLMNIDFDEVVRGIAIGLGVDHKVLRDKFEVMQQKLAMQQLQAMQAQQQSQLVQSEVNRNNAGASNLNNAQGANQYGRAG